MQAVRAAVTVRNALVEDIEALLDMSLRMHLESRYSFLPFSREKVRALISQCISEPDTHCAFVAEIDGRLGGMLGGYLADYFFCDEVVACDFVVFVDGTYRGTRAARTLVKAFQQWAASRNAREICLGISTDVESQKVARFYSILGFTSASAVFRQRLC